MYTDPGSVGELLHAFHRMHHGCMRREMEERRLRELTNPGILFVLRLAFHDRPVSQRDIAERLSIAPPTVAISIKRMERAGLVVKEADGDDMRRNRISLTERGKRLVEECIEAERSINQRIFAGFTPEEQQQLKGFYERMICNLEESGMRRPQFVTHHPGDCPHRAGDRDGHKDRGGRA